MKASEAKKIYEDKVMESKKGFTRDGEFMKGVYQNISDAANCGKTHTSVFITYREMGLGHFDKMIEMLEEDGYKCSVGGSSLAACNFNINWE